MSNILMNLLILWELISYYYFLQLLAMGLCCLSNRYYQQQLLTPGLYFKDRTSLSQIVSRRGFLDDLHIVKIAAMFISKESQTQVLGTGIMIGFKYVFTAAHLLYSKKDKKYLDWAKVWLNINNKIQISGSPQNVYLPDEFKNTNNHFSQIDQHNFGLLELRDKMDEPFVNEQDSKPLYLQFNKMISKIRDKTDHVLVLGFGLYANQKERIQNSQKAKQSQKNQLRLMAGRGTFQKQKQLLRYKINASEGMSGGPILQFIDGNLIFLGIHLGADSPPRNNDQKSKGAKIGSTQPNKQQWNIGLSASCFISWVNQIMRYRFHIYTQIFKNRRLQKMLQQYEIQQKILKLKLQNQQSNLILVQMDAQQPDIIPQRELINPHNHQQKLLSKETGFQSKPSKKSIKTNSNSSTKLLHKKTELQSKPMLTNSNSQAKMLYKKNEFESKPTKTPTLTNLKISQELLQKIDQLQSIILKKMHEKNNSNSQSKLLHKQTEFETQPMKTHIQSNSNTQTKLLYKKPEFEPKPNKIPMQYNSNSQSKLIYKQTEFETIPMMKKPTQANSHTQQKLFYKTNEFETRAMKLHTQSKSYNQTAFHEPNLRESSHYDSINQGIQPVGLISKYMSAQQQSAYLGFEPQTYKILEHEAQSQCCQTY